MENWLSPPNRIIWLKAFKAKAKEVEIRDGRKFEVKYFENSTIFGKEKVDYVKVSPQKGFAPMAYFNLKRVTDTMWLTETDAATRSAKESVYIQHLNEFINSDSDGVDVIEQWPGLSSRLLTTVRQGFANAKEERGKTAINVIVTMSEGKVYLIKEKPNANV